jgi:hypothetical protein
MRQERAQAAAFFRAEARDVASHAGVELCPMEVTWL